MTFDAEGGHENVTLNKSHYGMHSANPFGSLEVLALLAPPSQYCSVESASIYRQVGIVCTLLSSTLEVQ